MKVNRLSLNCESLDKLLGGGLEHSSITNVYGPPGSGKSNIAIQACVQCIKSGKKAIFIDTEGGFSIERFSQISKNPEKFSKKILLLEPKDFQDQHRIVLEELDGIFSNQNIGLVTIDSLVSLYRLELQEEKVQEVNRNLAKQLSKLSNLARKENIPILVTNQIYSDFQSGGIELSGKDIPKYSSKTLVELRKFEKGKRLAILRKHRSMPEGKETEFVITESGVEKPKKKLGLF